MSEEKIEEKNNTEQENSKIEPEIKISNYISMMTEEETSYWLSLLDLDEGVFKELSNIIKNGKDLISIYNNYTILEKMNIDLHSINLINNAIEEGLEEQLKINITYEKDKKLILNIENEPKYQLKNILQYLEKLFKKKIYLTPIDSPNEILTPNTLITKKILLNPNKFCNLQIFDDSILSIGGNNYNVDMKVKEPKKFDIGNEPNKNNKMNFGKNLNLVNTTANVNPTKFDNLSKNYVSLFQNKANTLSEFSTNYQMPSQNNKLNNFGKLDNKSKMPSKPNEDFKYRNIMSTKEKEDKSAIINNNEMGMFNLKNNFKSVDKMDEDNNMSKNFFTQRNFNSKTIPNDNNNLLYQNILGKNKIDKNIPPTGGMNIGMNMDNKVTKDKNTNNFFNPKGMGDNKTENIFNNKTENRYDFINNFQAQLVKDKKNNNIFNKNEENNNNIDINNLIINNTNSKKDDMMKKGKEKEESDMLKQLREKYATQNEQEKVDLNFDFKKEYKPKTPITEGRRTIDNNMKFNIKEDKNNNEPLENKFLIEQNNNEFFTFNKNFYDKNKNTFPNNKSEDNNIMSKYKMDDNKMGVNGKLNRGLELNNFQYKPGGFQSDLLKKQDKELNEQFDEEKYYE